MRIDLRFVVAVMLLSVLAACSPPNGSKKKAEATGSLNAAVTDNGWRAESSTDKFSDRTVHTVTGEVPVDDDANGKLEVDLKYVDGDADFAMTIIYLNDNENRQDACNLLSLNRHMSLIGFVVPLKTRNEQGEIQSLFQNNEKLNCNVVNVHYSGNENDGILKNSSARKVLRSRDFRVEVPLGSGLDVVFALDFQNNGALRAFADTVLPKIDAATRAKEKPREEPPSDQEHEADATNTKQDAAASGVDAKQDVAAQAPAQPQTAHRTSFDCSHPLGEAEAAVCVSPELAALDRQYAAKYAAVIRDLRDQNPDEADNVRNAAHRFINRRNACKAATPCIERAYRDIIAQLSEYAAGSSF